MNPLGPTPPRLLVPAMLLQASLDARAETRKHGVLQHVRAGKRRIRRQREIVQRLAASGHETEIAERTLKNFEDLQSLLVQLARLKHPA